MPVFRRFVLEDLFNLALAAFVTSQESVLFCFHSSQTTAVHSSEMVIVQKEPRNLFEHLCLHINASFGRDGRMNWYNVTSAYFPDTDTIVSVVFSSWRWCVCRWLTPALYVLHGRGRRVSLTMKLFSSPSSYSPPIPTSPPCGTTEERSCCTWRQ